jgi:hypothetical protein
MFFYNNKKAFSTQLFDVLFLIPFYIYIRTSVREHAATLLSSSVVRSSRFVDDYFHRLDFKTGSLVSINTGFNSV